MVGRLLLGVPTLFVVSLLVFGLQALVPGDAAATVLGENATPEAVASLRRQMGLDQPFGERYLHWLQGLVHGDLGTSVFTGEPVTLALNARLGVTTSLIVLSVLVSTVVGVTLGMSSAVRGGWVARLVDLLSLFGVALPSFWVALVLVATFAVRLQWFPATGYTDPVQSVGGWLLSVVLPVAALSLYGVTAVAKQTRDSAMETLASDWIRVLRANGVPERRIVLRHVLRNASLPVVSVIGLIAVGTLDGTVFIENVFGLPGLGGRAVQGTVDHDLPVVMGIAVYFSLLVIFINLLVDLAYGLLNPRVRAS